MLVLGNNQRVWFTVLKMCSVVIIPLLLSFSAMAQNGRLLLRKGPGIAFPVVFEIPERHSLRAYRIQGNWVLLSDSRKQGWIHQSDLSASVNLSESQIWHIRSAEKPGNWHIKSGISSGGAYSLGLFRFWGKHTIGSRFRREARGQDAWQSVELAVGTDLKRFTQSSIRGSVALGVGVNEEGNSHWSDERKELTTGLFAVTLGWRKDINKKLGVVFRLRSDQAFSGNRENYNELAMIWNVRL